ncbi:MAG TPA: hypothetical protein VF230_14950 [Acidimicrobiales bacterium]
MRDALAARRAVRAMTAALAVVVGSVVVLAQAAALVGPGDPPPPDGSAFEVDDDDSGSAMFTAENLRPGTPVSNCISVAHRRVSGSDPTQLRLHAAAAGALTGDLRFLVEAGTGAAYGDCSTFAGAPLYDGTLAGFATAHADEATGLAVDAPGDEGQVAFRFTAMVLEAAAQGVSADATFTWSATSASVLPPVTTLPAPPVTTAAVTEPAAATTGTTETTETTETTPTTAATTATVPAPATGAATLPTTPPVSTVTKPRSTVPVAPARTPAAPVATTEALAPWPSIEQAGGPVTAGPEAETTTVTHAQPIHKGRNGAGSRGGADAPTALVPVDEPAVMHRLAEVALTVAEKGSFPGVLLLILCAFLFVQDLIDRRDPKLALAPVHAEPDVVFAPPTSTRLREA